MAKPCRYRLPGQDTWMSEDEFKKSLADGLLDKFAIDDKIAVRNFKPDVTAAEKFRAPVTETAPQAEVTPTASNQFVMSEAQKKEYDKLSNNEKKVIDELINDENYERSIGATDNKGEVGLEDEINSYAISFDDAINKALNISEPKIKVSETNEKFTFGNDTYDIDKANEIISENELPTVDVPVDVLPKMSYSFISIDENTVKNADISKPVIIAKTKDGLLLIDGHHRVRKAINENKPIKAIVLNESQTNQIKTEKGKSQATTPTEAPTTQPTAETKTEAKPVTETKPTTEVEPIAEEGTKRNVKRVSLRLTEGEVKRIKNTPVFKKYFSDSQIANLKAGDNTLSMNNFAYGSISRMGIGELTDITKTAEVTKTETKPTTEKVERKGPVEVEAETKRGTKVTYKAEVSSDGKTATVQSTAEAPFGGEATNPKIPNLPIKTDSNGNRYVETSSETRVYIDKVKEAPEAKTEAPKKEAETKRATVKILSSKPKLDDRGMPIITRFNQEIEFTKNNRAKPGEIAWEYTDKNGNKIKANADQAERAEKALQEQQKESRNTREKKKRAEANLNAMKEQADGVDEKEVAESEDAEWAAEATAEDTKPKEKKTKRGGKKSFLASQARGNSTKLLQTLLDKFRKLFPNVSIIVDENEFNQKAYDLGRNPQSAAILSDGIIYVNPLVANNNTAFEEYSHIYLSVLEQSNKPLYNKLIEEAKKNGKEYMDEVLNDPAYADIHDNPNAVAFEAASKMISDRAEKIFDDSRKRPILEAIKKLWENIANWFSARTKFDINRDSLDDIVKKIAREINGTMSISSISSKDLSDIQNLKSRRVQVNAKSIMTQSSARAEWFRNNFLPYRGIREDLAQSISKGRNEIATFEQRSKSVIEDFNKGISEYNKENGLTSNEDKVKILQDVNQALQDPVFRANWFASDASAEKNIKPHVDRMRGMIDDLQKKLVDSGLLTDDLEISITGNADMYVNTAYYAFSGLNQGNWLDLFTPQEQNQILDWVHDNKYTPATELSYTIDNDGKVTAKFINSFGVESESTIKLDSIDALKQFLGSTKRVGNKNNLNVDKLSFNTSKNKEHSIPFEFGGLDISSLGPDYGFKPNDDILKSAINEIGKANQDLNKLSDLIHGRSKLTGKQAAGATKKKKKLQDIHKLLLKEIKDPATNFIRTVAKQSNLLFNGQVEQAIIDSKYMVNYGKPAGPLTEQINNPASRLNGYYVSPEMYDFLMGKTAPSLVHIAKSGVSALSGKRIPRPTTVSNVAGFFNSGSAIAKAYVTIFSIGSNAANYWSGYLQLLKTGNLPIGMISAMRALEKSFEKIGSSNITKEDIAASFLNTVPTIIRGITKIAGETGLLKDGISSLTEDQKKFYGVSDYSQLNADQKARVLLEELISEGIINNNIDANVIQELTAAAFENEAIPNELVKSAYEKIKNRVKGFGQSTMEAASNSYSFSDSMFKAIFYINEKKKNWDTYGSVMLKKGASMEEVENAMKEKTATAVKQQMPTYDRSPEFLKAISKFPLIGSFVQFDFQSKVNDKNILVDIYNMMQDSYRMKREGFDVESSKLGARAMWKLTGLFSSTSFSYAVYKLIGSMFSNYDDDDDEAVSSLFPDYRKNNQVLHLDSNKKGTHEYLDFSRLDPQSVYLKYVKAFKKGGFDEGVEEVLKPYISPDIFAGAFIQTMSGLDKFGNASKEIEGMNFFEKMKYLAEERILPSGTVGQITKIIDGFNQREVNEVTMSGWNELANTYLGTKIRSINIDKEIGNKLHYDHLNKISDEIRQPLKTAVDDYNTKLDQFNRGKGGITQSELNDAKEELDLQKKEATEKANEKLGEARYMLDKYKRLGYNDAEVIKSLKDSNTPQYLINLLISGSNVEFDNQGNIIKGGTFKRFNTSESDLDMDMNMDMNLDLNLDLDLK